MSNSQQINASILASFAPPDRAAATSLISGLIEQYGGRELERVLGVVLAMADGDLASLADAVRLAHGDYRDVLALEGFTGAGKLRSEPARESLAKQPSGRRLSQALGDRHAFGRESNPSAKIARCRAVLLRLRPARAATPSPIS